MLKSLCWTDKTENWLKREFFNPFNCVDYGCSCIFLPISKKIGSKLYLEKGNRDLAHKRQSTAEEYCIAPRTGEKFCVNTVCISIEPGCKIPILDNACKKTFYGYLTEIAEPVYKYNKYEMNELISILEKLDLGTDDLRMCNLGRICGQLVLIDFDFYSHIKRSTTPRALCA